MDKIISLKSDTQFKRLYKKGVSSVQPSLVLYAKRNGIGCNRLGITTSKKIGNAVVRNRARRRLREVYRAAFEQLGQGYDFVLVARGKTAVASFSRLEEDFMRAVFETGVKRNG